MRDRSGNDSARSSNEGGISSNKAARSNNHGGSGSNQAARSSKHDARSSNDAAKREAGRDHEAPAVNGGSLRRHVPADIRDVAFHTSVRGYARDEVDHYVRHVNTVIAELEIARSPEAAVRHALERVGEQTSGILRQARDMADTIIHTARGEAEEAVQRATADSRQIVDQARNEAGVIIADAGREAQERIQRGERELASARKHAEQARVEADSAVAEARSHAREAVATAKRETDAILQERQRIIGKAHELAARLGAIADDAQSAPTVAHEPRLASGGARRGSQPRSGERAKDA